MRPYGDETHTDDEELRGGTGALQTHMLFWLVIDKEGLQEDKFRAQQI